MKELLKDKKVKISLILLFVVLVITLGASYAYFQIQANGSGTQKTVTAKTGYLEMSYEDGNDVSLTDLLTDGDLYLPLRVNNTGSVSINYDIVWDPVTTNTVVGYANLTTQTSCQTAGGDCVDVRDDFTWEMYELDSAYSVPADITGETPRSNGYLIIFREPGRWLTVVNWPSEPLTPGLPGISI